MDIAVCGNPTLDELVQKGRVRISPGGSALFASSAANYLGANVGIIGNIGEDYPSSVLSWLKHHGLSLSVLKKTKGPSTRFRIGYYRGSRRLWLLHPGLPVESTWKGGRVEGLHLGPVFNEISESLVRSLRKKSSFMSLDIQGLVRKVNRLGEIQVLRRNLDSVLRICDLVKASIDEAKFQTSSQDHQAGDVYAGAWLSCYLWTKDPVWAASVGAAFGSLASQRTGLSKFRVSRRELFRRTSWIYNHVSPL